MVNFQTSSTNFSSLAAIISICSLVVTCHVINAQSLYMLLFQVTVKIKTDSFKVIISQSYLCSRCSEK